MELAQAPTKASASSAVQDDLRRTVAPDQAAGRAHAVDSIEGEVREHEQDHERLHHATDPSKRLAVCDECLPAKEGGLRRRHRREGRRVAPA